MSDDDKMFLEFMDYLAFEEYQKEQEKQNGGSPVYRPAKPAKKSIFSQLSGGGHIIAFLVILFIVLPLTVILLNKLLDGNDLVPLFAFLIIWRLLCKLSD